jgi:hypothetical protein
MNGEHHEERAHATDRVAGPTPEDAAAPASSQRSLALRRCRAVFTMLALRSRSIVSDLLGAVPRPCLLRS